MTPEQALDVINRLTDGQHIRVVTTSQRVFEGIYDAEKTHPDTYLYFDKMDGGELKAAWANVQDVDFRNARALMAGGRMFVPPEHPMSGAGPKPTDERGNPLRPYTTRNR